MRCVSDTPDAGLWYALNRLETNYWRDVDLNSGRNAHEFYLPDGLYAVGENRFAGHDRIRAFYAWRARRGPMTARHLINNLQVFATDDNHARLMAILSLFWANDHPPVQGAPQATVYAAAAFSATGRFSLALPNDSSHRSRIEPSSAT